MTDQEGCGWCQEPLTGQDTHTQEVEGSPEFKKGNTTELSSVQGPWLKEMASNTPVFWSAICVEESCWLSSKPLEGVALNSELQLGVGEFGFR